MTNLATSWDAVDRHPEDPDELPVTHAWRELVESILDDPDTDYRAEEGKRWTRSALAKASGTTSSQIRKLLRGETKSSPLVRSINNALGVRFVEPLPISREYADIIELILKVDDIEWLRATIDKVTR